MIKANELRIGNLVFLNDKQKVWEIMNGFDIDEMTENSTVDHIALTEDWLLKAGFIKIKFLNAYFVQENGYKYLDMIIRHGLFEGHRFIFDFANEKYVNLKYVHQLQNLYFALTGEELVFSSTEP